FVRDRHRAWREALCVIEERTVGNDNTIAWSGRRLQLPESRLRPHFVKAVVWVHGYPDGTVSVFLGPHRLARFTADGQQISPDAPQPGSVLRTAAGLGQVTILLVGRVFYTRTGIQFVRKSSS